LQLEIARDGRPLAKFAAEHLAVAASWLEPDRSGDNVVKLLRFRYGGEKKTA